MKWRNTWGNLKDEQAFKESLFGVYRKHFAWLPVQVDKYNTVWLQTYYKVYVERCSSTFGSYTEEINTLHDGSY